MFAVSNWQLRVSFRPIFDPALPVARTTAPLAGPLAGHHSVTQRHPDIGVFIPYTHHLAN